MIQVYIKQEKQFQDVQITLQHTVDQVAKWCKKNNMSLNSDKTKAVVICNKSRLSIVQDLEIKVNNYVIESVEYQIVLGVIVDKTLSWSFHVKQICNILHSNLHLFSKISCFLNLDTKKYFIMQNYISVFKR